MVLPLSLLLLWVMELLDMELSVMVSVSDMVLVLDMLSLPILWLLLPILLLWLLLILLLLVMVLLVMVLLVMVSWVTVLLGMVSDTALLDKSKPLLTHWKYD